MNKLPHKPLPGPGISRAPLHRRDACPDAILWQVFGRPGKEKEITMSLLLQPQIVS